MANIAVQMRSPNGVTLATKGKYCPKNVRVTPVLQEKMVTPSVNAQMVTTDSGSVGMSKVTIPALPLQEKEVTPSEYVQIITPDEGYECLGKVTVGAIPAATGSNVKLWSAFVLNSQPNADKVVLTDAWLAQHRSDNNLCLCIFTPSSGADIRSNTRSNSLDLISDQYGWQASQYPQPIYSRLDDPTSEEGTCYIDQSGVLWLKNGTDLYWSDGNYFVIAWLA